MQMDQFGNAIDSQSYDRIATQIGGSCTCPGLRANPFRNGVDRPAGWTCRTLRRKRQSPR